MAAAWRLANAARRVTLIERRPYLGGRAYSFVDRDTGQQVDNGQHVFLGCCTAYVQFLGEIGTVDRAARQPSLRVEVHSPDGRGGVLTAAPLPAPLHLLPSFGRYPHIGWRDKARAVPALLRIARERDREREPLRTQSFGDWLRRQGQSARAIANFWNLIVLPTLNDDVDHATASMGFMVFQESLLKDRHGTDVGFARGGLSAAMGAPAAERLRERGATVLLGATAARLTVEHGRARCLRLASGETLTADAFVCAVRDDQLRELLPDGAIEVGKPHEWSPIVNLHVWYDRPVADFDFRAFVDSPVQWVFNRTRIGGLPGPGTYLTVSLSGAWEWWPMTKDALRERFVPELARALPQARAARVERFIVVKEQRATFRNLPGEGAWRPRQRTRIPNLFLAGDWTDTGWPATMEGAVRSGNTAAAALLASPRSVS